MDKIIYSQAVSLVTFIPVVWFSLSKLTDYGYLTYVDNVHLVLIQLIISLVRVIWNLRNELRTQQIINGPLKKSILSSTDKKENDINKIEGKVEKTKDPKDVETDDTKDNSEEINLGQEMIERFLSIVELSQDWKVIYSSKDITVQSSPKSPFSFRVTGHCIPAPPFSVFKLITNVELRSKWDKMFERLNILRQPDKNGISMEHSYMKSIWPISPRDCITQSIANRLGKNKYVIVNETPSKDSNILNEKTNGYVRMIIGCSGFLIESNNNEENSTRLIQILDGDPGTWIPSSVISTLATKTVPESMRKISELSSNMKHIPDISPEPERNRKFSKKSIEKALLKKGKENRSKSIIQSKSSSIERTKKDSFFKFFKHIFGFSDNIWISSLKLVGSTTTVIALIYWIMKKTLQKRKIK